MTKSPAVIACDAVISPEAINVLSCNTCQPPNHKSAAVAIGIRTDQAISIPRDNHQARSSFLTSKWFDRIQFEASVRCLEKLRTTRAPPNDSVTIASQCCLVPRMERQSGRILLIQVRCVKNTIGNNTTEKSNSRQSTNRSINKMPASCMIARQGL